MRRLHEAAQPGGRSGTGQRLGWASSESRLRLGFRAGITACGRPRGMSWTGTERLGMELGEWGKERDYQGATRGLGTRAKVLPKI